MTNSILAERIESKIFQIRGKKVMLDKDLALLYAVKPIALRQQVKRNLGRFPEDFMFQLSEAEAKIMVSQNVIPSKQSLGGIYLLLLQSKVWLCFQVFYEAGVQ